MSQLNLNKEALALAMREELSGYITAVMGFISQTASGVAKEQEEFQLDTAELYSHLISSKQTENATLDKDVRDIFLYLVCVSLEGLHQFTATALETKAFNPFMVDQAFIEKEFADNIFHIQLNKSIPNRVPTAMLVGGGNRERIKQVVKNSLKFLAEYKIVDRYKANKQDFGIAGGGYVDVVTITDSFLSHYFKVLTVPSNGNSGTTQQT